MSRQDIVLFHSALGLRPGVHEFAEHLREGGHVVHTPDLYDGAVFDDLHEGVARRDAIGIAELIARSASALACLPGELVFAGFSMGTAPAQLHAQTRPGARGALLLHGCLAAAEFEVPWPGIPLEVHTMERDPWVDLTVARDLVEEATGELFTYPGDGHLFTDPGAGEYDAAATRLLRERALSFLDTV